MRFSDRLGMTSPAETLQVDQVSTDLRNSIWNYIYGQTGALGESGWVKLANHASEMFFKTPADEVPIFPVKCREWLKVRFFNLSWYDVYNFSEVFAEWLHVLSGYQARSRIEKSFNAVLERERSGYRMFNLLLVPISNELEVASISQALVSLDENGLGVAARHIDAAMALLGQKPSPDFRNSIKESISAIESIAKVVSKSGGNGLDAALAEFDKVAPLHGALRQAFIKLYGWTSDANGVRHAMIEDSDVGFEEAKYMLVSCSAFANYLISKALASGVLKR